MFKGAVNVQLLKRPKTAIYDVSGSRIPHCCPLEARRRMGSVHLVEQHQQALAFLTQSWGTRASVSLYLDRCQVDTPHEVVEEVWKQIGLRRKRVEKAVDFGAGDGRFACGDLYGTYVGIEIDRARCAEAVLPANARLINECAFSVDIHDADVCLGNPPYVRNQDLPGGWRERAAGVIAKRTGVQLSGLANAWQYFFLLALTSTTVDGMVALVIPYEWVSRPSAKAIRKFITDQKWRVTVLRLIDTTFHRVLTTSSITIIDKVHKDGVWSYFEQKPDGTFRRLISPSGGKSGVLSYAKGTISAKRKVCAKRGLSPGTQKVFTLTEGERVRLDLSIGRDVVPCVTTLKPLADERTLNERVFNKLYRDAGHKCWLIKPSGKQSHRLKAYLEEIPDESIATSTCKARDNWWEFVMPDVPDVLVASGFRGKAPKSVANTVGARAVGGVCGIYGVAQRSRAKVVTYLRSLDLSGCIVPHSKGLKKLEINQLNTLLDRFEGR